MLERIISLLNYPSQSTLDHVTCAWLEECESRRKHRRRIISGLKNAIISRGVAWQPGKGFAIRQSSDWGRAIFLALVINYAFIKPRDAAASEDFDRRRTDMQSEECIPRRERITESNWEDILPPPLTSDATKTNKENRKLHFLWLDSQSRSIARSRDCRCAVWKNSMSSGVFQAAAAWIRGRRDGLSDRGGKYRLWRAEL